MTRIYIKNGVWHFIGNKFSGAHIDLYILMMAAKRQGETVGPTDRRLEQC